MREQLEIAARRMATEHDDIRYETIAREFDRLEREVRSLTAALESARQRRPMETILQDEVNAALSLLDDIERIASDEGARAQINPVLERLGLRIGLTFGGVIKGKKRVVRRLVGGMMAFGDTPLQVRLHGADNAEAEKLTTSGYHIGCSEKIEGGNDRPAENPQTYMKSSGERNRKGHVENAAVDDGDRAFIPTESDQEIPMRLQSDRPEGISITKVNRSGGI